MHPDIMNIILDCDKGKTKNTNSIIQEIENIIHKNKPLKIWMWRVYI